MHRETHHKRHLWCHRLTSKRGQIHKIPYHIGVGHLQKILGVQGMFFDGEDVMNEVDVEDAEIV